MKNQNIETEVRRDYERLTRLLIERKLTITTMESATSGQIASLITDTEGSSDVFEGACITYSNEAKIKCGVSKDTIERYSVYSKETAEEMAGCCRMAYPADIGIGVTGTMGNIDPKNETASVPGQVYFAVNYNGVVTNCYRKIPMQPSRFLYKMAVAKEIVMVLFDLLLDGPKYNFYGWQNAVVSPIDEDYKSIQSLKEMYDILWTLWTVDTCAPRLREEWTMENRTLGQCSITAFLVQDIFGGKVYGILRPGGNYHCYNVIDGICFDLTSEQFGEEAKHLVYEGNKEQFREVHFRKEEKRLRYEALKKSLCDALKK